MDKNYFKIIEAHESYFDEFWNIFREIILKGDTYVYDINTTKEQAKKIWFSPELRTFVAIYHGKVVGSYIIKPNYSGLGSHVANCSYMVDPHVRGLGIGRLMGEHSLKLAKEEGFLAMQFNIVVSTNTSAVKVWQSLGFKIIGTSPKSFNHKELGLA